jgi:hypothetical protein
MYYPCDAHAPLPVRSSRTWRDVGVVVLSSLERCLLRHILLTSIMIDSHPMAVSNYYYRSIHSISINRQRQRLFIIRTFTIDGTRKERGAVLTTLTLGPRVVFVHSFVVIATNGGMTSRWCSPTRIGLGSLNIIDPSSSAAIIFCVAVPIVVTTLYQSIHSL